MTKHLVALFAAVAASATLVAGCGGGGGSAAVSPTPSPPPGPVPPPPPGTPRGTLVGTTKASTFSASDIDTFDTDGREGPIKPGETASCGVSVREIQYATVDSQGVPVTASAGLLVPTGGSACTQKRPLLSFQHGTSDRSNFDGAAPNGLLPQTMAKYFASHGYVVVIPDYLGYGTSVGHYHPYVVAEAEATTVVDAVRAARNWFASADGLASGATLSSQLFLSGTSEGGYITMATHRTMERDFAGEFAITADVPISGAYDLATEVMDDLQQADAQHNEAAGSTAFMLTGLQAVYGDVWSRPSDVFQSPWDTTVVQTSGGTTTYLYPSATYDSDSQAINACQIPFNITASPSPQKGNCSRNPLLQPQFVTDYESANPGTPGGTARAHVEANGLLQGWHGGRNAAPMVICYGDLDTTATANATTAGTYFGLSPIDVQVTGPAFITSWMASTSQNPNGLEYHGGIEAPGCTAYARYAVFDTYVSKVP